MNPLTPRSSRRFPATILVAAAVSIGFATAPAQGAVTIGSDLTASRNTSIGGANLTFSQGVLPGRAVTSPYDGVIVRWRVNTTGTGTVRLRVLSAAGSAFTGGGAGPVQAVPVDGINTFSASLPIRAGEYVGVDQLSPSSTTLVGLHSPTTGAVMNDWNPTLGVGETRTPFLFNNDELLMNADVERDVDCDGLGDETQDPVVSGGCLPAKAAALLTSTVKTDGRSVALQLSCATAGGDCKGNSISLQTAGRVKLGKAVAANKGRRIPLGSASFSISAGGSQTVVVPLAKAARKLLELRRKVTATATTTGGGQTSVAALKIKSKGNKRHA